MESSVVNDRVRLCALEFLIVYRIMLYTCSNTILLDTLYIRHNHLTRKVRILTHILEVTSVKRCTTYVHSRTEKDVLLTVTCLLSNAAAEKMSHFLVPCSSEIHECRKCST